MKRDPKLYQHPTVAFTRLMNLALEVILVRRHGVRVKWSLQVDYYMDEQTMRRHPGPAVSMGGKFSSGEMDHGDARFEEMLTGNDAMLKLFPEPEKAEGDEG